MTLAGRIRKTVEIKPISGTQLHLLADEVADLESESDHESGPAKNEPPPAQGTTPIADLVLADIAERVEMGRQKYGTLLKANNGRDALWDAYQEALDLVMYLRQEIVERGEK